MTSNPIQIIPTFWKYAFLTLAIFWFWPAVQSNGQDTVSTANVTFSSPDSASPAINNRKNASLQDGKVINHSSTKENSSVSASRKKNGQTLWAIFIAGIFGGLAALLMPCIFPMIPLTVSYFTKKTHSRARAINSALLYGLSIIVIYVVVGLIITIAFGADALNSLSTNGIFNFFFFLLLVVFAASFLGAFEITLPNSWVNKMDQQSEGRGFAGIFFMAATLSLVSFSCTGPIIGTLLVQAATTGAVLGPAIGMLGFSLALAIPFVLFAMFPNLMQSLPKSGGWLNSVKVVLGFLELGLSLKFLSNVDLAYHWHWFDREVFLVLWIVISAMMGMYLLGKLTLSNDSPLPFVSVPRLFLAIVVLSFTMYMVPGLWGAPLKSIAAFLPPQDTQDFDLYTPTLGGGNNNSGTGGDNGFPQTIKYADLFHAPLGLHAFFDYQEGLAFAKKVHKPVMIDFTGHACVNCRKMEATVWPDKSVLHLIRDNYVLIQLYVDDKTNLPANEQYTSSFSKRLINNIGALNSDIQAAKFNSNSQPDYVLLDPQTEHPLVSPQGAVYDAGDYAKYLISGLNVFKK
jgi:thiol:disulfide interchange protein